MDKLGWICALLIACLTVFPKTIDAQEVMFKPDTARYRIQEAEFETGSPFLDADFRRRLSFLFEEKIPEKFGDEVNPENLEFFVLGKTDPQKWYSALEACGRWGILDSFNRAATCRASMKQKSELLEGFLELNRAITVKRWMVQNGYAESVNIKTGIYGAVDKEDSESVNRTVDIIVIRHRSESASELLADLPAFKKLKEGQKEQNAAIKENRNAINETREVVSKNRSDIDSLKEEVDQLDFLLGIHGVRSSLGDYLVGGHVGLQINSLRLFHHVETTAAYMVSPTASGRIQLPEVGISSIRTHAFGVELALFPVRYVGLVAGVQRTEEVFLDVGKHGSLKKGALLGLRLQLPMKWLSISAEALWAPGVYSRFDLAKDKASLNGFQIGLRLTPAL